MRFLYEILRVVSCMRFLYEILRVVSCMRDFMRDLYERLALGGDTFLLLCIVSIYSTTVTLATLPPKNSVEGPTKSLNDST